MKSYSILARLLPLLLMAGMALAQEEPNPQPDSTDEPEKPRRSRSSERSRAQDSVSIGVDVHIKEDDRAHDVVVIGADAQIDGTVDGEVLCVMGKVTLGTNALLKRGIVVIGGLDRPDTAEIRGEKVVIPLQHGWGFPFSVEWVTDWIGSGFMWGRPLPHQYVWSWTIAGVFLLIYLVLAALFPRPVQTSMETLQARPGGSLMAGLLALLLIIPLIVLLVVTVVGIIVVPFLICGFVAVLLFGKVAVYRYAGQQIGDSVGAAILEKPLVALLIGAILFYLLYTIPILGFIVWGAIIPFGIGAVLLALFGSRQNATAPKAPPVMVPYFAPAVPNVTRAAVPISPTPPSPETPTGLVRVGFWLRFLATALDFVLIALITGLIFRKYAPAWFIPIWVIYHIGMWGWKGTTIGGIILNLKIVRLDGSPINLVIALVRSLAAFLSAAVFFLGFFWAGWSTDKQAWHDKIAGTCVVKYPKGLSLI